MINTYISLGVLRNLVYDTRPENVSKEKWENFKKSFELCDKTICVPKGKENNKRVLAYCKKENTTMRGERLLDDIVEKPENIADDPFGVFVLDVSKEEAARLQGEYGIVCVSGEDMDFNCLTKIYMDIYVKEDVKDENKDSLWTKVLKYTKGIPANAFVVLDKYLFQRDSGPNGYGINAAADIIKMVLPASHKGDFHISFLVGKETGKGTRKKIRLEDIANWLQLKVDNEIKDKSYNVNVELVAYDWVDKEKNPDLWKVQVAYLHDRYILSNYYFANATAGIIMNEAVPKQQNLYVRPAYSGLGVVESSDFGEFPVNRINRLIKGMRNFVECGQNLPKPYFEYFCNGKKCDIKECRNPLLVKPKKVL